MTSLVIDATNQYLIFALTNADQMVYATSTTLTQKNLVNSCVQILDRFLKKNHVKYNEIKRIYLNQGPGSFTGTKVGVNIAKTIWSVYQNTEIFVANTIEILGIRNEVTVIDARGNKSYFSDGGEIKLLPNSVVQSNITNLKTANVVTLQDLPVETYIHDYLLPSLKIFHHVQNPIDLEPLYVRPAL